MLKKRIREEQAIPWRLNFRPAAYRFESYSFIYESMTMFQKPHTLSQTERFEDQTENHYIDSRAVKS